MNLPVSVEQNNSGFVDICVNSDETEEDLYASGYLRPGESSNENNGSGNNGNNGGNGNRKKKLTPQIAMLLNFCKP